MKKMFNSGQKAEESGQFEIVDSKGKRTGEERTATKGKRLAPTPKPGQHYILVDKTKY
ncbi:MAG: hypothetical protein PHI88_01555 [Candidatus Pacebacteria bacterium]|nr:hypothetical protein [Candidatus Paceibacterota bacterium]